MTIRKSTAMIAAITMLAVGACAKKAPDTLPPAPEGTGTDPGAGTGTGVIPGSQEDFLANVGLEGDRSEEHTSELQSLMRTSYAVFCLKKKTTLNHNI